MNLDYAGTIRLRDILDKFGVQPFVEAGSRLRYLSPFSSQQTKEQLEVNQRNNTWHDTEIGIGGGPIEFVQAFLLYRGLPCKEGDVLHWFRFNVGYPKLGDLYGLTDGTKRGDFEVMLTTKLQEHSLARFAMREGMSLQEARGTFKQVRVLNKTSGHKFLALGMRNEDDGYAIYSPHVRDMTPPTAVSFIRGTERKPAGVHVFVSIFDYCAVLRIRRQKLFEQDCIILHLYTCADDAVKYIRNYGYRQLYSWFDNSDVGKRATQAFDWLCGTEPDLKHRSMNSEF